VSSLLMSLTVRDRLSRGRSRSTTARMLRELAVIGGNYGKRIMSVGAVPGGAAGAAAVAGVAAAMGKKAKVAAKRTTKSGGTFNPGSAGGFVTKTKRPKKSRKKLIKARSAAAFKRKVVSVLNKEVVSRNRESFIFAIQTTGAFPAIPMLGPYGSIPVGVSTTTPLPRTVGWHLIECPKLQDLKTRILTQNSMLRSEPWVTDGLNEIRKMGLQNDLPTSRQLVMEYDIGWKLELRNNSNGTAKITFYVVKCNDDSGTDPLTELNNMRNNANVSNVTLIQNPPTITRDYEQYWGVKLYGRKRHWRKMQEFTAVLNPGDTCEKFLSAHAEMPYHSNYSENGYLPGSWALIARIEGTLAIDRDNPSLYDYVGAVVGCHMSRTETFKLSKTMFDRKDRLGPTVAGAVVNPVIAMDAAAQPLEE